MAKKSLISEEERILFRTAMENVIPLAVTDKVTYRKPKPSHFKIRTKKILDIEPLDYSLYKTVTAEEFLQFARPSLQKQTIEQLHRSEFTIDAILDLHGLTLTEAEKMLARFIAHALEKHWRCVQIIHGKSTYSNQLAPPLKNSVNNWLRTYKVVLAFCSCQISDGGTGAVYVLLKTVD